MLLALLVALAASGAYADDVIGPYEPPQGRIIVPTGMTSQAQIQPPTDVDARIHPPDGTTSQESPTLFDLFLAWLRSL